MTFDYKRLLLTARSEFPELKKDAKAYNYKYVALDQIIEKCYPVLHQHNFAVSHAVASNSVITTIHDFENDATVESVIAMSDDLDPQEVGSAITYYKRYNLSALLDLVADEDSDGARKSKSSTSSSSRRSSNTRRQRRRNNDDDTRVA